MEVSWKTGVISGGVSAYHAREGTVLTGGRAPSFHGVGGMNAGLVS